MFMDLNVLQSEMVHFLFNGVRCSFQVKELEDGYWGIECGLALFCVINGSSQIKKAESVDGALKDLRNLEPVLALAMQEAYNAISRQSIAAHLGRVKDRKTYYHLN